MKRILALIAGLMMINALGIDIMLPALPNMAHALATGLYRRWVGLFRTALGRSQ